jgi:hypothetical protein
MVKKVTITKVFISDKNKDGVLYTYKNGDNAGRNFVRVSIKTEETGDDYYSSNTLPGSKPTQLKEGEVVLLDFTEDNGFKNFRIPTKDQLAEFALKGTN